MVLKLDTGGQDELHATPFAQHLRLAALPHGVRPLGHPQIDFALLAHATPATQQASPQAVWPAAQQQFLAGLVHAPPAGQQASPHTFVPAGQPGSASPRKGFRTAAPTAAAAAAPMPFSTPRRLVCRAIFFARSSN